VTKRELVLTPWSFTTMTFIAQNGNQFNLCQSLTEILSKLNSKSGSVISLSWLPPAARLPAEIEQGNHEYKFTLANITPQILNHRISQLRWRLQESMSIVRPLNPETNVNGVQLPLVQNRCDCETAYYHIGVDDDGTPRGLSHKEMFQSLQTLQIMAEQTECDVAIVNIQEGQQGLIGEIEFKRRACQSISIIQSTVAFVGDMMSGKSSLIGVLSSTMLDNGRGAARVRVCRHNHELMSGRTSSITHTPIQFDATGK
jgi:hypothetical protein